MTTARVLQSRSIPELVTGGVQGIEELCPPWTIEGLYARSTSVLECGSGALGTASESTGTTGCDAADTSGGQDRPLHEFHALLHHTIGMNFGDPLLAF
ncbi:hypothetical protein [Nocardia sp. NPDC003963]